jgi:hypothetical protein
MAKLNKIPDYLGDVLSVVNNDQTIEDYFKERIDGGYISENGAPLKCECGCTEFKDINQYYGEGWIEEYSLECTNEDCLKIVGTWSFGNWEI